MTGINEKAPDGAVLHRQFNPLHFGIFIANPYGAKIDCFDKNGTHPSQLSNDDVDFKNTT